MRIGLALSLPLSTGLSLVYTCVRALVSMAAAETRKEAAAVAAAADDERETLNLDSVYRG